MTPKISVLIPLYNRKHFISDAVDSVLRQTFQDFELIIRDNASTDGGFEFVQEKYSKQISEGKIKLFRNEKNLGEFPSVNRLVLDAQGKYFMVLHSDDLLLPQALQHLFDVAENYSADVVHSSYLLNALVEWGEGGGGITESTPLQPACWESNPAKEITLLPDDPMTRFNEWYDSGTMGDVQYNFYKKSSFIDKVLLPAANVPNYSMHDVWYLYSLMKLKVFVKTPVIYYVRRNAPDSLTNDSSTFKSQIGTVIQIRLDTCDCIDRILDGVEFFDEHPEYRRAVKMKCFGGLWWRIARHGRYKDGITPEIDKIVQETFEKYFGRGADFVTYMFHMLNLLNLTQPNPQVESFMSKNFRKNAELQK